MITELLKMNELPHNCLKTCNKACEMEWLCNDKSFYLQNGREGKMRKVNDKMENNFRMVLSALVSAWYLHGFNK